MEELATKIAELLDITVESAIELYPVLRNQFMVYKIVGIFEKIAIIIFFITLMHIALSSLINFSRNDSKIHDYEMKLIGYYPKGGEGKLEEKIENLKDDNIEHVKKQLKKSIYLLIPLGVLIISKVVKYVFATDLIILKEFL